MEHAERIVLDLWKLARGVVIDSRVEGRALLRFAFWVRGVL